MADIQLNIVTPEKTVYEGAVRHLRAPGSEGSFGVLPGHTPLLVALQIGQIMLTEADGASACLATSGGFAEVRPDRVIILAETAERAEKIDTDRARGALERAEERLRRHQSEVDMLRAQAALHRALNRLKVAGL